MDDSPRRAMVNPSVDSSSFAFAWDFGASVDLFGFGSNTDWALDPPDVDFLSNFHVPTQGQMVQTQGPVPTSPRSSPSSRIDVEHSDVVREAFRQSIGPWNPDSRHYRGLEEQSMSSIETINLKLESLGQWDPSLSIDSLTSRVRDKLLAMALMACEPGNVPAVVSAFPTSEVLQRLINISLTSQKNTTHGFIHIPTFSTADCRPEIVAAVIMEGAVKSSSRAVQKFGLSLGEILHYHLQKAV